MAASEAAALDLLDRLWVTEATQVEVLKLGPRSLAWHSAPSTAEELTQLALPRIAEQSPDFRLLRCALPEGLWTHPLLMNPLTRPELDRQNRSGACRWRWHAGIGVLQIRDPASRRALIAHHPDGPWRQVAMAAPWPWVLQQLGGLDALVLHAACVSNGRRCWLIPGVAGTGKSTVSAALYLAGWRILGDDYVLLDWATGCIAALFRSLKLSDFSLRLLGRIDAAPIPGLRTLQDKSVLTMDASQVDGPDLQVDGIVLLDAAEQLSVSRSTTASAVRALVPSTLAQLPGDDTERYARISAWLRPLPVWRLGLPRGSVGAIGEGFDALEVRCE